MISCLIYLHEDQTLASKRFCASLRLLDIGPDMQNAVRSRKLVIFPSVIYATFPTLDKYSSSGLIVFVHLN